MIRHTDRPRCGRERVDSPLQVLREHPVGQDSLLRWGGYDG